MQEKSGRPVPSAIAPSLAISVTLHLIVILTVGFLPARKLPPPPIEHSITVEIISEPQIAVNAKPTVTQKGSNPTALPAPTDQTSEQDTKSATINEPIPQVDGMVRAKEFFSTKVLADPRSKEALVRLRQLGIDDRVIQLCNIEAMEQVHVWKSDFQPDFVVAYAMAEIKLSGVTLQADGAALRSKQLWYAIRFRCEVTPDLERVVSFEFSLGAAIPKREWETHSLPEADDLSD